MTWPWSRQKVKLRKGCVLLKGLTLRYVSAKYFRGILNTSAVTNSFQNLNTELKHGFKWQSMTWPWPRQKVKLRKGCGILKGLTLMLVWAKYWSDILNTSAVTNTFQNLNTELEHGFKWQTITCPWPRQKFKLRTGCVLSKGLTLR